MARRLEFTKGGKLDWEAEIERLNRTASGQRRIVMGSDGSAQVTRVRLLSRYANLRALTEGRVPVLERRIERGATVTRPKLLIRFLPV